jgi:hypothetical protein
MNRLLAPNANCKPPGAVSDGGARADLPQLDLFQKPAPAFRGHARFASKSRISVSNTSCRGGAAAGVASSF